MNGPFFSNYTKQQPSRYAQSVPVLQTPQKSSPKIVSVPVHFISSDQPRTTISMLKDSAALKIQKVFRGFALRKSVKKIDSIRNEVSEIERKIHDSEVVNLIRSDPKERLRVNETLMSLLFKLDSIRGVDSGVRDLRRSVTKKAIALQEKVDSICQPDQQIVDSHNDGSVEIESDSQTLDSFKEDSAEIEPHNPTLDSSNDDSAGIDPDQQIIDSADEVSAETDRQNASTSTSEHVTEASNNLEAVDDDNDGGIIKKVVKEVVDSGNEVKNGTSMEVMEVQKHIEGYCADYDKGSRDLLNQLMADNEKMMKLMMQISERNEMQTRMINSLSQRVEQLEKAFMADKLRKKKRTHAALRRRDNSFCN